MPASTEDERAACSSAESADPPAKAPADPPQTNDGTNATTPNKKAKAIDAAATAAKVKQNVTKSLAEAGNLIKVINASPEWSWARNPGMLVSMDAATESINKTIEGDAFAQFYMTRTVADTQNTYADRFGSLCGNFNTLLKDKAVVLNKETAIILQMHIARMKNVETAGKNSVAAGRLSRSLSGGSQPPGRLRNAIYIYIYTSYIYS